VDVEQLGKTMERIREIETLDDTEELVTGLCYRIVDILEENKKNTAVVKNENIVKEIQVYVEEHFADHGLSLESVSERWGYSSGYIGKMFKSLTGSTFSDYVTHTRLEHAKELLAVKGGSVAQIGEQVGVYNVPYFTTLFKKKYGMTPSQYRDQVHMEENKKR
jgi:YesN/AraC family two-component response regulator